MLLSLLFLIPSSGSKTILNGTAVQYHYKDANCTELVHVYPPYSLNHCKMDRSNPDRIEYSLFTCNASSVVEQVCGCVHYIWLKQAVHMLRLFSNPVSP